MQSTHKVVVGVLVLLALGLGLAVYNQNKTTSPVPPPPPPAGNNQNNTPPNNDQGSVPTPTEAEKAQLYNIPAQDAPDAEKKAHFALAAKFAVKTDTLTLNGCEADPFVIRVTEGSTFTVKNSSPREVQFGFDQKVTIPAGGSAMLTASFKNGAGLYGYNCYDNSVTHPIGFVWVTAPNAEVPGPPPTQPQ